MKKRSIALLLTVLMLLSLLPVAAFADEYSLQDLVGHYYDYSNDGSNIVGTIFFAADSCTITTETGQNTYSLESSDDGRKEYTFSGNVSVCSRNGIEVKIADMTYDSVDSHAKHLDMDKNGNCDSCEKVITLPVDSYLCENSKNASDKRMLIFDQADMS